MDTLNDLLAASDLISLHCALTNETVQIISAECLQHIKPGTLLFTQFEKFAIIYFLLVFMLKEALLLPCRGISCEYRQQSAAG